MFTAYETRAFQCSACAGLVSLRDPFMELFLPVFRAWAKKPAETTPDAPQAARLGELESPVLMRCDSPFGGNALVLFRAYGEEGKGEHYMQQTDQLTPRPSLALYVSDLVASRAFYIDMLGFKKTDTPVPDDTVAEIVGFGHDPILLVGPDAGDVTSYLQDEHLCVKSGITLTFFCQDFDVQQTEWTTRGLSGAREVKMPFGERILVVRDRDENTLLFTTHSAEDIFELYAQGPRRLQEALAGIAEPDLELTRGPDEWSMRQLVHHIVDGDDLWIHAVKAALTRSGCHYRHDWYTPDNLSAQTLDYAGRAIEPALLLFRANHDHILQLVRHLPDASKRFVLFAWPDQAEQRFTVLDILYSQAMHVNIHCDEILALRHLHQQEQPNNQG